MQNSIVKPTSVSVRTLWPNEAGDFTPWLAPNLDWLEVLGLGPLTLLQVEADLPDIGRSLDILAETSDGRRVAIENQYSVTDHDHLTRGLAYAIGHQAEALVIISEDHRPEFVAVADYLNRSAEELGHEDGISIFLVRLTVDQVGEYHVPRFEALSRPNEWVTATRQSGQATLGSVEAFLAATDDEHRERWEAVTEGWQDRVGGSIRTTAQSSIALCLRDRTAAGGRRVILSLYVDGKAVINRQHLAESDLFAGAAEELDALITDLVPRAHWSDQRYYVTVHAPDPDVIARFADAIQQRIDEQTT